MMYMMYIKTSLYIKTCRQSSFIYRVFATGGMGRVPQPDQSKICSSPPPSAPNSYSLPPKVKSIQQKNKSVIFNYSHCSCTIFVLTSYSFKTQIMLILILIDIQDSQNPVFSFEKFSNCQNHFSSGSHHLVKKPPQHSSLLFDTKSGTLLKF